MFTRSVFVFPDMGLKFFRFVVFASFVMICSFPGYAQSIKFTDTTNEAGIHFRYNFGDHTYENILESSGSGVTVFDYDNDGDLDLYLLNGTYLEGLSDTEGKVFHNTPDSFYRNNGDGTFTDVTREVGLYDTYWSMAAGAMDYDDDGDVDLYLLNFGPNRFFRNNGNGTFSDITDIVGLKGPDELNGFTKWSVGAAFWDQNNDGLIDLMVCNFLAFDPAIVSPSGSDIMPHPAQYHGQASMFYQKREDGTFHEVTRELGMFYPESKCMGITIFDYDDDGDQDIFQGNDHQENFLFRNEGNGRFTEVATVAGVAVNDHGKPTGSMHGSIGDIDGDGLIDLLVVDLEWGALYRNRGNGLFEDVTRSSGLAANLSGKGSWAAALFDYDNDGDLDLFSANGAGDSYVLSLPLLMENDGKGHFRDVGLGLNPYFSKKRSGRGGAVWDYDNDGDLDIIVNHVDLQATATLLRNDGGNRNHWLGLTLIGKNGMASAIGAKVVLHAGDHQQVAFNQWATSYLSYNDPRLHFGLGNRPRVDKLEIRWPDGEKEVFHHLTADRYITIVEGKGVQE